MYNIYLKEEDLLKADQFPVIALLNEAANSNIIEFAENLEKVLAVAIITQTARSGKIWMNMTKLILQNLMAYWSPMRQEKKS